MKQGSAAPPASARAVLLEGNEHRQLWRLAGPMVLALLVMNAQGVANSYFLGRLSGDALNMAAFAVPLCWLLTSVLVGYGVGVTSAVARALGSGKKRPDGVARGGMVWALLLCVVMSGLGLLWGDALYARMGLSPSALPLMQAYMDCWWLGFPGIGLTYVGTALLRGTGESRTSGWILILVCGLNIALDPMLIFGFGPVPALGAIGAAVASGIGWGAGSIVALRVVQQRVRLFAGFRAPLHLREAARVVFPVSGPSIFTYLIGPVGGTAMVAIVARAGEVEITAYGVAARICGFTEFLPFALAAGLTPLVAQNAAAGERIRVARAIRYAQADALFWGALVALPIFVFARPIATAFSEDPRTAGQIVVALRIGVLALASTGVIRAASAAFNAVGQGTRAAILGALRSLVLPVPMALVAVSHAGLEWAVASLPAAAVIVHAIALRWLRVAGLSGSTDETAPVGELDPTKLMRSRQ